jgi:hypothetical protein
METQNIEYKPSWRDEFLKVIVAFANSVLLMYLYLIMENIILEVEAIASN